VVRLGLKLSLAVKTCKRLKLSNFTALNMPTKTSDTPKIFFTVIGIVTALSAYLLYYALADNTLEAMKSLVQADAALIGFLAVITIFMMNALQDLSKQAKENMLKVQKAHKEYEPNFGANDDVEYSRYKKKIIKLAEFCGSFTALKTFVLYGLLTSALLLIFSIFTALLGMSKNSVLQSIGVNVTVFTLVMAITVIFYILQQFSKHQQDYSVFEFECLSDSLKD
jgi:hypothetical protein